MQRLIIENKKNIDCILAMFVVFSAVLFVSVLTLRTDIIEFLKWWFVFFVFSTITLPITTAVFKNFFDKGYVFGKTLGLLFSALVLWQLSHFKLVEFSFFGCLLSVGFVFAICFLSFKKLNLKPKISIDDVKTMVAIEVIFFAFLSFWTMTESIYPFLYFTEKPMDFGFLSAIRRSDFLPANDIWFAGESINYYYFGQYIFAFLGELLNSSFQANYSMAVASVAALACAMSLSLGQTIAKDVLSTAFTVLKDSVKNILAWVCGLLTVFLVNFAGNSHSFFYGEKHIGNGILKFLVEKGIVPIESNITDFYFFYSTRFIGHNPDSNDQTIHEFPFYSYILKDLHAHVASIVTVVVFIAVIYAIVKRLLLKESFKSLLLPIVVAGILLGTMQMTNYWDYIIYTGFFAVLLFFSALSFKDDGVKKNEAVDFLGLTSVVLAVALVFLFVPNAMYYVPLYICILLLAVVFYRSRATFIARATVYFMLAFTVANLIGLPFSVNFTMFSNSIKLVPNSTELWQYMLVWLGHIVCAVMLSVLIFINNRKRNDDIGFFGRLSFSDLLLLITIFYGLVLIIVPEIIYVVDIYVGHLRSNTMFKFTYQGFMLLSIGMAFCLLKAVIFLIKSIMDKKKKTNILFSSISCVVAVAMIVVVGTYPVVSFKQALFFYSGTDDRIFKGIESGFSYVKNMDSPEIPGYLRGELKGTVEIAEWFNETKDGNFNILEAYGASFSNYALVSSYTGLSTVLGQRSHELLWRHNPLLPNEAHELIDQREHDVKTVYFSQDKQQALEVIEKYDIKYIVVGPLEKQLGESIGLVIDHQTLSELGEVAFESNGAYVIEVYS